MAQFGSTRNYASFSTCESCNMDCDAVPLAYREVCYLRMDKVKSVVVPKRKGCLHPYFFNNYFSQQTVHCKIGWIKVSVRRKQQKDNSRIRQKTKVRFSRHFCFLTCDLKKKSDLSKINKATDLFFKKFMCTLKYSLA